MCIGVGAAASSPMTSSASSCCSKNDVSQAHGHTAQSSSTSRVGDRVGSMKHPASQHQRYLMNRSGAAKVNPSCSHQSSSSVKQNIDHTPSRNRNSSSRSTSDDLDVSTSSSQQSGKCQDKLILLRRSVQFTTSLKFEPNANDGTPEVLQAKEDETDDNSGSTGLSSAPLMLDVSSSRTSHLLQENSSATPMISKPLLDGAYDLFSLPTEFSSATALTKILLKSEPKADVVERRSSFSKYDLSSSWLSLLSKDTASTSSTSIDQFDGAYDLFSLPSDSSISPSRSNSIRSLDNISGIDRLSLHDDISECSTPKHRKVSFDSTVKATTIPSRLSYSSRMKTRLWSSTEDIYSNAIRNEKEFAFDGSDWRTASEESDFLRCPFASSMMTDDVLVHPVHFVGLLPSPSFLQQKKGMRKDNVATQSSAGIQEDAVDDNSGGIFDMD